MNHLIINYRYDITYIYKTKKKNDYTGKDEIKKKINHPGYTKHYHAHIACRTNGSRIVDKNTTRQGIDEGINNDEKMNILKTFFDPTHN